MPFKCIPFESDDDFYDMMPALWEAFENPFNSFLRIVFYLGSTEERTQAIEAAADGTLSIHKATPGSNWLKVVDSTSGYLIGAANWILYESNPYDSPQEPIVAVWWPEGDGRDYATNYLQQVSAHKRRFFNRPHVCKYFVRPQSVEDIMDVLLNLLQTRSQYLFHPSEVAPPGSWKPVDGMGCQKSG